MSAQEEASLSNSAAGSSVDNTNGATTTETKNNADGSQAADGGTASAAPGVDDSNTKEGAGASKGEGKAEEGGDMSADDAEEHADAEQGSEDKLLASLELYGLKPDLVDKDGKPKISRKLRNLLAKKRRQHLNGKSVVVDGLQKGVTQEELQKFCEKYGPVLKVFLRYRLSDNFFKGSAFVTFHNQDDSEKMATADELTFSGYTITTVSKNEYLQTKKDDNRKRKMERRAAWQQERKRQEAKAEEELKKRIIQGTVVYLTGFQNKSTNLKDIKNYFKKYGNVRWVDFDIGDKEAWVRFSDEFEAVNALEAAEDDNDGKVIIKDDELEVDILEGEDELEYWKQLEISQEDAIKRKEIKNDSRMRNMDQNYWGWKQKQPRWW